MCPKRATNDLTVTGIFGCSEDETDARRVSKMTSTKLVGAWRKLGWDDIHANGLNDIQIVLSTTGSSASPQTYDINLRDVLHGFKSEVLKPYVGDFALRVKVTKDPIRPCHFILSSFWIMFHDAKERDDMMSRIANDSGRD
jgi:hypothetical protein